ncbi:NDMA-dependent alcohol dehydrogenase [Streptomyces sp. RB17]|uniref:NDMA-dependent alcohol dehydrogenase n=1 Tax=Streptomyces sp. RB17 TaxID=2585197 RepID=UPI0012972474|nr:NDMA-dependent alcohol dehydrogenase [Streptomyces sp. RB17]MQY40767.1 NDMA-dependent alcohol dehydrogenase [Streptomyces sp. RB17]
MKKSKAALLWEQPGEWKVSTVDVDAPGAGEILVKMTATGLCHSDDHLATGDSTFGAFPVCGGHEGAGVVEEVGPGVYGFEVGDHVVTSFVPSCGKCKWCAGNLQQLCDNGMYIMNGGQMDGTYRMHLDGKDIGTMAMLGTFSEWQVYDQMSLVKVRKDIPLDVACLVACGVPTGWGSAVNAAEVRPGHVVIVMGVGGVGMNAVQGAANIGASHVIAVDPVEFKRTSALEFGATEAFATIEEAADFARSITQGQGADSAIVTTSLIHGDRINEAFGAIRKAGIVAVTAQGSLTETGVPINLFELSMFQKRIQGVLYGMTSPRKTIPALLDLYADGILKLDELVTKRYTIEQINEAYRDMREGRIIRGVVNF